MKTSLPTVLGLALATSALATLPAAAQDLERGETVLERPRPEVEALGLRAGSFIVLPRLETGITYDSNVFATENNTSDDIIYVVNPELAIRSDFGRHAVNLLASGTLGRYRDFGTEDFSDYLVSTDGRLDVSDDIALDARLFHRQDHEGRGDPDSITGLREPTVYTRSGGAAGYSHRFNRVRTRLAGTATYWSFDNNQDQLGRVVEQDDRNRWELGTTLRVGYEIVPGYEAFVRGGYFRTIYTADPPAGGFSRSSWGYEAVAGAAIDLTGVITGEVFAGWLAREYQDERLKDFGGIGFGGRLNWAVTQLTTITGLVTREVRETTVPAAGGVASSYDRTLFALGADHELLRTLILNARVQFRQDDYNGIDRTDDVFTAGVGATYLVNRSVYLTGGYTYETRESDAIGTADYDSNIVFLRLGLQL